MTGSQGPVLKVHSIPSGESGRPRLETTARELNDNLAALQGLLKRLLEMAGDKLTAIRAADADELQGCTALETDLLEQVKRVGQERAAVLARAAQCVPVADPKTIRLSELAGHWPEPFSSVFRARNEALRKLAADLQEKNRLVASVARHLQSHIRAVFAELAKVNQESVVYGPKGQHYQRNVRSWVDAVG